MNKITENELDNLDNNELVSRMDAILSSPYWSRRGNKIMLLSVKNIFDTERVQGFSPDFQRKVIYKAFGLLLQLHYTKFSYSANFFQIAEEDEPHAKQLYSAARNQWTYVSSRIIFEYFMHLTYMIGTGKEYYMGKSSIKKYKTWLKKKDNPYTYFAISVMRAESYDRTKRSPEIHAGTKLARKILLLTASDIDDDMMNLANIMESQWGFILHIANDVDSKNMGWVICGTNTGDKEWYEVWESGNQKMINSEIDKMFTQNELLDK